MRKSLFLMASLMVLVLFAAKVRADLDADVAQALDHQGDYEDSLYNYEEGQLSSAQSWYNTLDAGVDYYWGGMTQKQKDDCKTALAIMWNRVYSTTDGAPYYDNSVKNWDGWATTKYNQYESNKIESYGMDFINYVGYMGNSLQSMDTKISQGNAQGAIVQGIL